MALTQLQITVIFINAAKDQIMGLTATVNPSIGQCKLAMLTTCNAAAIDKPRNKLNAQAKQTILKHFQKSPLGKSPDTSQKYLMRQSIQLIAPVRAPSLDCLQPGRGNAIFPLYGA